MRAGFTGTQQGATAQQLWSVEQELVRRGVTELGLGDCIGADTQVYWIARRLGIRTIGHPPLNPSKRSFLVYDEERPLRDYLVRNHCIVDEGALLIATPAGPEVLRSGTWATIRYSLKKNNPTSIFF